MIKKGFTLIELMVIILIVAIMAAVTIPIMKDRVQKINAQVAKNIEKQKAQEAQEARKMYDRMARNIANQSVKDTKPVIVERVITKQYDWKRAFNCKPTVYQLVLIKLDNDIITTGRLTDKNEWKVEADKMKYSGGRSVKVVSWKEIDVD